MDSIAAPISTIATRSPLLASIIAVFGKAEVPFDFKVYAVSFADSLPNDISGLAARIAKCASYKIVRTAFSGVFLDGRLASADD